MDRHGPIHTSHQADPHTDDGDVNDAVSEVTRTADSAASGIRPGQFGKFEILVGQLPAVTSSLTFKAVQTYSNGDIVRWIETQTPGGPDAEHPAPVLQLTAPGSSVATATTQPAATTPVAVTGVGKKTEVDS